MKIYELIVEKCFNYENHIETHLFKDIDSLKDFFENIVEKEKKLNDEEFNFEVVDIAFTNAEFYNYGYYAEDHIAIWTVEHEI